MFLFCARLFQFLFFVAMTPTFREDIPFLPKCQHNWAWRFLNSPFYRQFTSAVTSKRKKIVLDRYPTGLVETMKDARTEIAFLRKLMDRRSIFCFVFDTAKRLAKQKVRMARSRPDTSYQFDSLEQLLDRCEDLKSRKKISDVKYAVCQHVVAVGWDNGTRLVTILRFPLETVTSEPVPTWYIFWYEIKTRETEGPSF